jgi:rhodanese-related sulfurtransferase
MKPAEILKKGIIQSAVLAVVAAVVSFSYNALSDSGIDPFRDRSGKTSINKRILEGNYGVRNIGLDETIEMIDRGAVVIDARTENAYRQGHIPGAILFDYYMFGQYADLVLPQLDPTRSTVIYCSSPDCGIAESLARELYSLGYENLHVFEGGFSTWEEEGRPVEKGL